MEPGKNRGIVALFVLVCHFACTAKDVRAQPVAGPPTGLERLKLDGHQPLLPVVLVNAGFGAAIGLVMDALSSGTTLYRQSPPAATAGRSRTLGVSFSRRF